MNWKPTPRRLMVAGCLSLGGMLTTFGVEVLVFDFLPWWGHFAGAAGCFLAAYAFHAWWPERSPLRPRKGDEWASGHMVADVIARALMGKLFRELSRKEQEEVVALVHAFEERYPKAVRRGPGGDHTVNARILRRWVGQIALRRSGLAKHMNRKDA